MYLVSPNFFDISAHSRKQETQHYNIFIIDFLTNKVFETIFVKKRLLRYHHMLISTLLILVKFWKECLGRMKLSFFNFKIIKF